MTCYVHSTCIIHKLLKGLLEGSLWVMWSFYIIVERKATPVQVCKPLYFCSPTFPSGSLIQLGLTQASKTFKFALIIAKIWLLWQHDNCNDQTMTPLQERSQIHKCQCNSAMPKPRVKISLMILRT